MKNTIIRLRNHPSLILWTGGNEFYPRKTLYDATRQSVIKLDGTRPFIACSAGSVKLPKGWKKSWPGNQASGFYSGGPYSWVNPVDYYHYVDDGRSYEYKGHKKTMYDWVFKDETGIPSQPPYNSLRKFIPDLVPDTTLPFPLNNTWGYHDACAGNGKYQVYYKAIVNRYGKPKTIKQYSEEAQLANANSYRAIFEAAGSKLNQTGGVMLWKLNSAWPSVVWQIYDWFLEPNAGYYYIQKAVQPLHVQFDLNDSTVAVVNRQYLVRNNLKVDMRIYNEQSRLLYSREKGISVGEHQVTNVTSLKNVLASHKGLSFIELTIRNQSGKVLSHNFYWLASNNRFEALNSMPKVRLRVWVSREMKAKVPTWRIHLMNPTDKLAFFIRGELTTHHGKKEVLPSYWSGNYVNLGPHESMTLTVKGEKWDKAMNHQIVVSGWNVPKTVVRAY